MKALQKFLNESITNNMDNSIKNTISLIEDNNLDELIIQKLQPSTEDSILNDKLGNLENAFKEVIERLQYLGYIDIRGYRIQQKLNK